MRELGDHLGIRSTNGVRYHLKALAARGYLSHEKGRRRDLQLLNPDGTSPFKREREDGARVDRPAVAGPSENVVRFPDRRPPAGLDHWWRAMPVVGRVAAGAPVLAEENREDEIGVDQALFGGGPGVDLFGLRIDGESMTGAGIHDGDLAIIRKTKSAGQGDIVVALVNDDATVKRFLPEESRIVLKAENPDYRSIVVTEEDRFEIAGVMVGLIRRRIE